MAHLLFAYGTLLHHDNPIAQLLKNKLTYVAPGVINGELYDIGDYPGLIINNGDNRVYGIVYDVDDETLAVIDDYEGYGPEQDQPNLYTRKLVNITAEGGVINAWVYIYNLPVTGLPLISSGNYQEYLAQKNPPKY